MRILKIMLIILILGGLVVPSVSCGSKSDEAEASEIQMVTVQRGNLVIEVTAVGNLALSRTEDLAFDIFYPEATVEEVLVEEGESVEEGQVLAKLDTSEWDEELTELKRDLLLLSLWRVINLHLMDQFFESHIVLLKLPRTGLDLGHGQHVADHALQSSGLLIDHVQ